MTGAVARRTGTRARVPVTSHPSERSLSIAIPPRWDAKAGFPAGNPATAAGVCVGRQMEDGGPPTRHDARALLRLRWLAGLQAPRRTLQLFDGTHHGTRPLQYSSRDTSVTSPC